MRIRKHDYCTGVQSKMCSFITQHNATDVASFDGACNWHSDCRNVHQSCCSWIECLFLYHTASQKKNLYYARYRVCDVTCTTVGGNTQPRWQPNTAGDAVVTATVTALLIKSMRRRCVALREANGGHTRYWLVFGPPRTFHFIMDILLFPEATTVTRCHTCVDWIQHTSLIYRTYFFNDRKVSYQI